MNQINLTRSINNRIDKLKNEVNNLPGGGGLEVLKVDLQNIQRTIDNLMNKIDEVEFTITGLDPKRF